jgi:hypothetical protein
MRHTRLQATLVALVAIGFSACASEEQRYKNNRERATLSPKAKATLSSRDIDQLARLVAHTTRKRIIAISRATKRLHPDAYDITIGLPWSDRPSDYGFLIVAREKGGWRIIQRADGLSLSLVGLGFSDPPD